MEKYLARQPNAIRARDPDDYMNSALHYAAFNKDYEMIRFLMKCPGSDINIVDENNETPLYKGVHHRDVELCKFLVDECGANINHYGNFGRTPLYFAGTHCKCEEVTRFFLTKDEVNVNQRRTGGRTPLIRQCAMRIPSLAMIKIFLDHPRIDINITSNCGLSALHEILNRAPIVEDEEALKRTQPNKIWPYDMDTDISSESVTLNTQIAEILLKKGADPNYRDSPKSPLRLACQFGHAKAIDLLAQYGADVNAGDRHWATPLHWCFFSNQSESLKALIKHKPKTDSKHKIFFITPIEGVFKQDHH